jgi:hypothetical protein
MLYPNRAKGSLPIYGDSLMHRRGWVYLHGIWPFDFVRVSNLTYYLI